jgi:hypothetical protein
VLRVHWCGWSVAVVAVTFAQLSRMMEASGVDRHQNIDDGLTTCPRLAFWRVRIVSGRDGSLIADLSVSTVDPEFASAVVTQDLLVTPPAAVCASHNVPRVSLSSHADPLRVWISAPAVPPLSCARPEHFKYTTNLPNYPVSLLYVVARVVVDPYM